MQNKKSKIFHSDPRTKLYILLICALVISFSTSIYYECGLVMLILCFGVLNKKMRYSFGMAMLYVLLVSVSIMGALYLSGTPRLMLSAFTDFIGKMFPCIMAGGILVGTTQVSEFMAAMNCMKMPKNIVIPMTVMIRYIPMIREDWGYIKDSIKMRDVAPSLSGVLVHPGRTIECVYVPLVISASKVADELSAAAVTRGIETDKKRTCLEEIHFNFFDAVCAIVFTMYLLGTILA
ncbi:energy-coupling factor transporter transmembrane component T [Anaeromicropila populeti]|uniref:Energy-coupling factor transport system permease protein n=1 Tax=Anaeromicropila populeti TaxID=37658 RepID=A0A1I6JYH0_9FIRM|nr:energy-coupling factor transporter transmembrane component T [Anaeromicropila populeti]SFR83580.1 energy-coupling factor transport system permease protein [Anaeromicropila populeti]